MTITVLLLLGIGIGVPLAAIERRLMKRALLRQPGPVPPWQTFVSLAVMYGGWALIRWLATLPISQTIERRWFTYAAVAYAIVHIDVAMFVVKTINSPATARLRFLWRLHDSEQMRRGAAVLILSAAIGVLVAPVEFEASTLRLLAAGAGLVAGGLLLLELRGRSDSVRDR